LITQKLCTLVLPALLGSGFALVAQNPPSATQQNVDILLAQADFIFKHRPKNPVKRSIKKIKSDNDPSQINIWVTEIFDGLVAEFLQDDLIAEPLLGHLAISGTKFKLPLSIQFEDSRSTVLKKVGPQCDIKNSRITYTNTGDGYPHTVTFFFAQNRLKKIEWNFIVD